MTFGKRTTEKPRESGKIFSYQNETNCQESSSQVYPDLKTPATFAWISAFKESFILSAS